MAKTNPFQNIRLVYKRTPTVAKIMILCAIVLSTAALLMLRWRILDAQSQLETQRQYAQQLEEENRQLQEYIDELGSVDSIDRISQDELDMIGKDSIILQPES